MPREKRLIIPIFLTLAGCPQMCVFCDQRRITGREALPSPDEVKNTIDAHLSTWNGPGPREVAFYGGTFTGLPIDAQEEYLKTAHSYIEAGKIQSIRISTRPDCISDRITGLLKSCGVATVELGVQSMSDEVLRLSKRGHTVAHVLSAVRALKGGGFSIGLQLMPGLPGDDRESILNTAREAVRLGPQFVRVYPAIVLKGTELHEMYLRGDYVPWTLHDMASVCREVLSMFREENIKVIRVGLQDSVSLRENIIAGPYHPSFRQVVEGIA
jgi:histone acetyltransferase (RNA polymerase elongator complex component)